MTWSYSIRVVRELSIAVLILALMTCALGRADKQRKATVLPDGGICFSPNRRSFWASPLLVAYLIYVLADMLRHLHGSVVNIMIAVLFGLLLFMIALSFPSTITATDNGLKQIAWLWHHKRIRWRDIVEVKVGGGMVKVTGADGTRIVHTHELPDGVRLLMEIRRHCGENLPPDFPDEAPSKS